MSPRARARIPFRVAPMLATLVAAPIERPGWVNEEKYDGYRLLAYKEADAVTLLSRNGNDRTAHFATIARSIAALPARTLLLDGEAVAFDAHRVSRFQLLQRGPARVAFAAFDCLYRDGEDLRARPLRERRRALLAVVPRRGRVFAARRLPEDGRRAYAIARARGWEGLIAKDDAAPYVSGRSRAWCKVKVRLEEEVVIAGFTAPAGSRSHFGALLLGAYDRDGLRYVGKVGTGFDGRTLDALARAFRPLAVPTSPFVDPPRARSVTWLRPQLVAQVAFTEMTADGRLRHPAFLGLRDDKAARECRLSSLRPRRAS